MCSAAMAIGSACTERWITQSGVAGSVGVLVAHASYEKQLEDNGIEITLVHSGAHKVDGNPYESLPDAVKAKLQAKLDKNRAVFAKIVADNIGMSVEAVMATEALTYQGQEAVDIGFADRLVNGVEAVPLLIDIINTKSETGNIMPKGTQAAASQPLTQAGAPAAAVEALSAQGLEAARLEGATAERERCHEILTHPEAQSRMAMAVHLATGTSMSAEEAVKLLELSPASATLESTEEDAHQQLTDGLSAAMDSTEQPNLQVTGDSTSLSADESDMNDLLSAHTN